MEIIIDYNNDKVIFKTKPVEIAFNKVKDLVTLQAILEEMLNRLDSSRLSSATPYFDVMLTKYDEDQSTTIGEW